MARIVTTELADTIGELPRLTRFRAEGSAVMPPDELFLCALGFEPRCLTLPERLANSGYRSRRAVYFKYSTNANDNRKNLPSLRRHLHSFATMSHPMDADHEEFPNRLRQLLESTIGEAEARPPRVTFDISVTANRLLLKCMAVLLEFDIRLRLCYSEAEVYHPTREEYRRERQKWGAAETLGLERGVLQVSPSIDHPGHALDPMPDFVILFPSFKRDRSRAVISFVDPSLLTSPGNKVVWLLGRPRLIRNGWRLDAMKAINGIAPNVPQYEVSTFDYRDSLAVLERLHAERSETHTITVSPLGSKMQALGTALSCYMHPDVRVLLSTPKEYNALQYSDGCRGVWCVDFGALTAVRHRLDAVGTLRIEE